MLDWIRSKLAPAAPPDVAGLCRRAAAAADAGRAQEALEWARRAVAADAKAAAAHYALGRAWEASSRYAQAESSYRDAVTLDPGHARAHTNLGCMLHLQGKLDAALACYRRALELEPSQPEANQNYAAIVQDPGARELAIRGYLAQAAADPADPAAFNQLANLYAQLGRYDDARANFDRAIALAPERAEAHFAKAHLLLLCGEYAEGWKEYEWRWRMSALNAPALRFPQPMWEGGRVSDGIVLIHGETGLGDMLQFVRYARLVAERSAARVIVECPGPLASLVRGVEGVAGVVARGEPLPRFDAHVPLIRLPAIFGTTLETVPWRGPYINADAVRASRWAGQFRPGERLRVGLVWAGNPENMRDRDRSVPPGALAPLARTAGAGFYSLQKFATGARETPLPAAPQLIDLGSRFADFSDTAAAVSNLDVVVSIDTSVAHLAGAMGKPVWVLLAHDADWRYHLRREDNPWYPTMRLFRQETPGEWRGAVERVVQELQRAAETAQR